MLERLGFPPGGLLYPAGKTAGEVPLVVIVAVPFPVTVHLVVPQFATA